MGVAYLVAHIYIFFLVTLWDYLTQRAEDFTGKESRKTKTSDPSSPNPNKVELGAKWVKMSGFFGHNIARESGGGGG